MHDDAVIIVTGAARGLGRAMALGLLRAGRRVVGADIGSASNGLAEVEEAANALGAATRFLTATVDIRSVASADALVAQTLERFGTVHGLVNNAGLGPYRTPGEPDFESKTFLDVPVDYWTRLTDTNINGTFIMTRAVAPHLLRAGWGRVVTITTSLTTMTNRGMAPYGPRESGARDGLRPLGGRSAKHGRHRERPHPRRRRRYADGPGRSDARSRSAASTGDHGAAARLAYVPRIRRNVRATHRCKALVTGCADRRESRRIDGACRTRRLTVAIGHVIVRDACESRASMR